MSEQAVLAAAEEGDVTKFATAVAALPDSLDAQDIKNEQGQNSLHIGAGRGSSQLCEHLLNDHRFHPAAVDSQGATPLGLAAAGGHSAVVDLLLSKGADANSASAGQGPVLLAACTAGHSACAASLLNAGADPKVSSPNGMPAVFLSAAMAALKLKLPGREEGAQGTLRCLELLLDAGADPNVPAPGGFTPLHVAAEAGSEAMLQVLLQAGADLTARTDEGQTPLALAASWGHRAAVGLLLQRANAAADAPCVAQSVDEVMVHAEMEQLSVQRRQRAAAEAAAAAGDAEGGAQAAIPQPEDLDEGKAEVLRGEGNAHFVAGRYNEAVHAYRWALRHAAPSAALWANTAAASLRLGNHGEALREARVARTVDPKFLKAWFREGQAAEGLQLWEDAAAAYFEAHLLQPDGAGGVDFGKLVRAAADKGRLAVQQAKQAGA